MKKHQAIVLSIASSLLCATGCASRAEKETASTKPPEKSATAGALIAGTSEPVRVSAERADAAEPSVAAAPDGTAYVVWVEHRPGKEADVMLARLDRAGNPTGAATRVNPQAGAATAWRGDPPSIAVAPDDGAVHVVWTSRLPHAHGGHANTLYLSTSRDGGQTFGPPVKINDDEKPAVHGMHSMAVAADGRVHVAWLDERNVAPPAAGPKGAGGRHEMESNREVFVASSGDGGRSFSPNKRVATEACPCCKTSLLAARDGLVYVSWRQVLPGDFRHIAVASSGDRGVTFSEPVIVSDDRWVIAGCPVSGAALADGADGALRVLWYSAGAAGAPGLYWSESRDAGRTFTARQLVAAGEARGTPLLLTDARNEFVALGDGQRGGTARLIAARLSGGEADGRGESLAVNGELPAAVAAGGQFIIAYIVKADGRRAVWLARAKTA